MPPTDRAARAAFILPDDVLYLDTAAHGPRLHAVQAAAMRALAADAMPWRRDWNAWSAAVERVRTLAATLFDGAGDGDGDADAVALVPSAAHGLSIAAHNLPLAAGDAVLVLADAFPSNLLPWQQRCRSSGARLHAVASADGDWTAAVLAALEAEPALRVLALPAVRWHDGALLDLDAIAAAAHARGIALVLDLSQSLGAQRLALSRWRPAYAVAVGYKWLLGPEGLAYLWASPAERARGLPLEHTWLACEAREDWTFAADAAPRYRPGARRFDAGGIADAQRLAMAEAGLAQVLAWGVDGIAARLGVLTGALRAALPASGFDAPRRPAAHVLGVRPRRATLPACAQALQAAGIACTVRHGVVRIAPHLHVDADDIARVAAVLAGC